jgi:hypothetical protein
MGFLLILAILSLLRTVRSEEQTVMAVVNAENETNGFIFYTNKTETSATFSAEIRVYNVANLKMWLINLSFNPMLLQCTGAKERWWPRNLTREWPPPPPLIENDLGYVTYGDAIISTSYPGLTGNVTLCSISFQIIRAPCENETLTCEFEFDYPGWTWLINSRDEDISFSVIDGYYKFYSPPRLKGDINLDHVVDMRDIGAVTDKYGTTLSSPDWDPRMDVNEDLRVDLRDIGVLCLQYRKTW